MMKRHYLLWAWLLITLHAPIPARAQSLIDSLAQVFEQAPSPKEKGELALKLGQASRNQGDKDALRHWGKSAIRWATAAADSAGAANGCYQVATSFYLESQPDSMEVYLRRMEQLAKGISDDVLLGRAYLGLGLAENLRSNFQASVELNFQALEHFEHAGDKNGLNLIYGNLSTLLWNLGDREKAIFYNKQKLALAREVNDGRGIGAAYNNLGTLYEEIPQLDSALYFRRQALSAFRQMGDTAAFPHLFANSAATFREAEQYDSAWYYVEQGLAYVAKGYRPGERLRLLLVKGQLLQQDKAYPEAESAYQEVLRLAKESQNTLQERNAFYWLATNAVAQGDYQRGYDYLESYNTLRDSIINMERIARVEELETRYQTSLKEAELARKDLELVRQRNRQILLAGMLGLALLAAGTGYLLIRGRQRAREREAQLALQLREQEAKNLRELDSLKSRFFANISHEFRTPLTLILTPLQQMLDGALEGSSQTYLQMMQRNGERLLSLINQLLDLSRLEAGKMELQLSRGDVVVYIRSLAAQFESLAISKHIRFHVDLPAEPVIMAFDPDKLEKTLSNLLSNAFKFTPEEGDVWLRVEVGDGILEMVIEDNGIGMSEDQLAHVFDRFYRVESEGYSGTGIGLALVRELTELANGRVSVSSEPGKGSAFAVSLPLQSEVDAPVLKEKEWRTAVVPASGTATRMAPEQEGERPLLLIVEDNPDVQQLLQEMLAGMYEVHLADDGQQGLEKAQALIPDLVISDVMMPEMDGYELTRRLKSDERTSHIPVVQLTAKAGLEAKLEGLEIGADDYLSKPFEERELKARVRNLLEQRERMRQQFGKDVIRLGPSKVAVASADQQFLERVIRVAEEYMQDEAFSIEDLGREVGLSRSQLHRKLKALTGQSPSVFLRSLRLKRAKELLQQRAGTAAEISYLVGFGSPAYFSKCFKDEFGVSPGEMSGQGG